MKTFQSALLSAALSVTALAIQLDNSDVLYEHKEEEDNTLDYPGDNCCVFYNSYDTKQHSTDQNTVCHDGAEVHQSLLKSNGGELQYQFVGSYICGRNTAYYVCRGEWCFIDGAGYWRNPFIDNMYHLDGNKVHASVAPYNLATRGAVTLFQDANCKGRSKKFYWNSDEDDFQGAYTSVDVSQYKGAIVPYSYGLKLFKESDLMDLRATLTGKYDNDRTKFGGCQPLDSSYTMSLQVVRGFPGPNGFIDPGQAVGFWKGLTATESQTYEYHVGMSQSSEQGTAEEEAQHMSQSLDLGVSASVTVGFNAGVVSGSASVGVETNSNDTWGSDSVVATDARSALSQDYGIIHTTTCTSEESDGTGIYQWIVESGDGRASVFSSHTVCRTGELFNIPPRCPWPQCVNADCSVCSTDV